RRSRTGTGRSLRIIGASSWSHFPEQHGGIVIPGRQRIALWSKNDLLDVGRMLPRRSQLLFGSQVVQLDGCVIRSDGKDSAIRRDGTVFRADASVNLASHDDFSRSQVTHLKRDLVVG